jgi:outer membrane protein TolC
MKSPHLPTPGAARQPAAVAAGALLIMLLSTSCSTTHYRESADREVYSIIDERGPEVAGMPDEFTIDAPEIAPEIQGLPVNQIYAEFLGEDVGVEEEGAHSLSLEYALALAFTYSRDYQNAKESLYLQALSLTLDRHEFDPIFFAVASGAYARTTFDEVTPNTLGTFLANSPAVAATIEGLTGQPADLFVQSAEVIATATAAADFNTTQTDIVNERSVSGNTSVGVNYLLKSGGRLALNLTSNFLRFLTGDPRESAFSTLTGAFVQPLLRDAGRAVTIENLTQAERDLLYELRGFTRFRKVYAVAIASQYYGVLNSREEVRNAYLGLEGARRSLERQTALADEGRVPRSDVARFEQQELAFESSWINAIRRYNNDLDSFKIALGLPTDAPIILDPRELEVLAERGVPEDLQMTEEEAVQIALATRLDVYTQRDRVDDAGRRIKVAANALKPGLDLIVEGQIDSKDGNRPLSPDWDRAEWSAGLDLDLGLDRKAERNAYRASLIGYERTIRDTDLFEDEVRFDVRDALRALDQNRRNYEISLQGVALNERRVEEQALLTELGRGNANDQVDAENDLISARNALTRALVDHTIARLQFFRDLGILYIKEDGQWEEII